MERLWLPRERDGRYVGAGSDRPRGGAVVSETLDPGLAVLRFVYDNMRIDAEWSVAEERAFSWWGHRLATRVTAEPGLDDHGIEVYRLTSRTAVLRDVVDPDSAAQVLDTGNAMATMSTLALDAGARTVGFVAGMWVHEQTRDIAAKLFATVVAMQAAQAHEGASQLAAALGASPAYSDHPTSGERADPDEMLGLLPLIRRQGSEPSTWAGRDMVGALGALRRLPMVTSANGDEAMLVLELGRGPASARVEMTTTAPHPGLGNGLLVLTSIEPAASIDHDWASAMNRLELEVVQPMMFLGSWVGSVGRPTFVSFLPNFAAGSGIGVVNIGLSAVNRAMWAATISRLAAWPS